MSILICLGAEAAGVTFTFSALKTWYPTLVKPSFNPPNWLFGPVWIILYLLMAISLYLIWLKGLKNKNVRNAVFLFFIQLILNATWSPVFFGARNVFLALIVIVILWFYILKTILAFSKIDKQASYLLYPYLAWVSFATVLNFSIWILNH